MSTSKAVKLQAVWTIELIKSRHTLKKSIVAFDAAMAASLGGIAGAVRPPRVSLRLCGEDAAMAVRAAKTRPAA
jgi:hypothetical protein